MAGQEGRHGVSRENAGFGFVPVSSDAPPGRDEDRFHILISTDVLAEGVNLQQCRNIINEVIPGGRTGEIVFSQIRTEIESLRHEENDLLVNAGETPWPIPARSTGRNYGRVRSCMARRSRPWRGERVPAWLAAQSRDTFFCPPRG